MHDPQSAPEFVPVVTPTLRRRFARLTDQDARALVSAYEKGARIKDLARRFGVHRDTVMACLDREEVPIRERGLAQHDLAEAIRLYRAGWSSPEVGKKFGVDARTVRTRLLEQGVSIRPRRGWAAKKAH